MKRKFSLFLNMAMLCLCVCAIAIGVYSAKTASLNVTGSIGFKAHNCELQVSGTKKGYALENGTDYQQSPVDLTMGAENDTTGTVSGSGASGTISSIPLGDLKFTDLATEEIPPIVITLTFTNLSAFQVSATVLVDDIDNVRHTRQYVKNDGSDLSSMANHVEAVILEPSTATENKTATFVITLSVSDPEKDVTDLSRLNITANFAKYDANSFSSEVTENNITYTLNDNKTAYSVTDNSIGSQTDVTIPALVNYLPVTSIGDSAFNSCESLTSITIPSSVTSICEYAFDSCSSLTSITMPSSVTNIGEHAFDGCYSLTSITIPSSVTSIGGSAFMSCDSLTSITIPSSVTSIGYSGISGCDSLTSITVDSNNATYKSEGNAILTKDGKTLLEGCKATIIPDSVTSIGDSAFAACGGLTSITIPSSVESIGNYAFRNCYSLTSITIGANSQLTSIGDYAFKGCDPTSITIPSSVESIGSDAFRDCDSLIEVCNLSTSLTITAGSTGNGYVAYYAKAVIKDPKDSKLTTINDYVIYNESETSRLLVKYIGTNTSLELPSTATSIHQHAFYNNGNITSVTIPSSVTSIGERAFGCCTSLTSIIFADTTKTWTVKDGSTVKNSSVNVSTPATNATNLTGQYYSYTWTKNS